MTVYLLDTNHASHLMGGSAPLRQRMIEASRDRAQFGISVTVLGELYFAVEASRHRERNADALQSLIANLIVWPFDDEAAAHFGRIQATQKQLGRPIPPMDAQIAAVARLRGATVLTADRHFAMIPGLHVENWLEFEA